MKKDKIKLLLISTLLIGSIFYPTIRILAKEISKTVNIIYFFSKDKTENGSGNPNWYYYWTQTKASRGSHSYDGSTSYYGYYNAGDNYFYIGYLASGSNNITGSNGIDCFAETCIHENTHLTDWRNFWPTGYIQANDNDNDDIPDNLEPSLGFDSSKYDTDSDGLYDFAEYSEPRAYAAEYTWAAGSADLEDWSAPGHQY